MPDRVTTVVGTVREWTASILEHVSTTNHVNLVSADDPVANRAGIACLECGQNWEVPVVALRSDAQLGVYIRTQAGKKTVLSTLIQLGIQDRESKREKADTIWDRLRKDDDF